ERDIAIVALDQSSARRVVLRGGQRQPGIVRKRVYGLHQALAEGGLPNNQATIMVLDSARDDLSRGCRPTIHQHHQRVISPAVSTSGGVAAFRRGAAVVRDD